MRLNAVLALSLLLSTVPSAYAADDCDQRAFPEEMRQGFMGIHCIASAIFTTPAMKHRSPSISFATRFAWWIAAA